MNRGTLRGMGPGVRVPRPSGTTVDGLTLIADSTKPDQTRWAAPDGWIPDAQIWTYASATTFTVPVDVTGYLPKGTKISYNDGAVDYGVVASTPVVSGGISTVTLITTTDYSIASAPLTRPRYSYEALPQGWPTWFNWSTTLSGWSANPTSTAYQWSTQGPICICSVRQGTNGTSNNAVHSATLPGGLTLITGGAGGGYGVDGSLSFCLNAMDADSATAGTKIIFYNPSLTNASTGTSRHIGVYTFGF